MIPRCPRGVNFSYRLGATFCEYLGATFRATLSARFREYLGAGFGPRFLYSLISLVPEVEYHFTVR